MKVLSNHQLKLNESFEAMIDQSYQSVPRFITQKSLSYTDTFFLAKVKKVIEEKIGDDDLDVEYLSKECHLSPAQLFRRIKALTNLPPMKLVNKIRLQKAKILIETTSLNISEVAYGVGFSDPNYFSRAFRREFKIAPSMVRKLSASWRA